MKQLILTFATLLIFNLAYSQEQEQLIGKWVFTDLFNADHLDEASKSIAKTQLQGQLYFLLKNDLSYEANIMGEEATGKWVLTDKKHLKVTMQDNPVIFEILKFSPNEIALKIGEGSFLMKKEKTE